MTIAEAILKAGEVEGTAQTIVEAIGMVSGEDTSGMTIEQAIGVLPIGGGGSDGVGGEVNYYAQNSDEELVYPTTWVFSDSGGTIATQDVSQTSLVGGVHVACTVPSQPNSVTMKVDGTTSNLEYTTTQGQGDYTAEFDVPKASYGSSANVYVNV